MKLGTILFSVLLGCGVALAQQQSSGTVNSLSVDPEQNQKLSGSMGTETGQPNDVNRSGARNEEVGNPSNSQISGQPSTQTSTNSKTSSSKQAPGGKPSANQHSASTNSGKAPRRTDNSGSNPDTSSRPH